MAAALRTAPGKPRSSWSFELYGLRLASSASSDMAQAISAWRSQASASYTSRALMAVSTFDPLMVPSPSRASRPGTGMPARSMASRPGSRSPS